MLQELNKRVEQKLISVQQHDTLPLLVWNYTQTCQFNNAWDEYTMMCRGLITDLDGNIVSRPFKKFFNINETEETKIENLPTTQPAVYTKYDGSLGILYFDGDKPCIATRGSFNSDQAKWATEWIQAKMLSKSDFLERFTYLFEIIYPENRIVVDYGGAKTLILLAVIETSTGKENFYPDAEAEILGFQCAQRKSFDSVLKIVEACDTLDGNDEGFVLHYENGLRVKIKGREYVRLHKLLTEFSSISIWECLRDGTDIEELLERVPDEFYEWVRKIRQELNIEFMFRHRKAFRFVAELIGYNRKEQAAQIKKLSKELQPICFSILNYKNPAPIIWKQLRPKYEKPFSNYESTN